MQFYFKNLFAKIDCEKHTLGDDITLLSQWIKKSIA